MLQKRFLALGACFTMMLVLGTSNPQAFPVNGDNTVLPTGSELNEDAIVKPREVFRSVASGGTKSYLVKLGDLAFNSPTLLGGPARKAGISCNTCHVNGAGNPHLFVPGLSTRHGNFDTTSALFNAKADDRILNPVTVPNLRGARALAPYGHDGRETSLRDFVHNVIVNEFAGPEPSPAILDAMVAYIWDIGFLPNIHLGPAGELAKGGIKEEARRGEVLFNKPFPHNPGLSCAGCHVPSSAFVDHQQHDVGSGGLFKTPTLINANFNAPYFHDGRFDNYNQVVAHFNKVFDLGLSDQDQQDLIAYLSVAGDGQQPYEHDGVIADLREINDFASVLNEVIPAHDLPIINLAVETVSAELREVSEKFPDRKDTSVEAGKQQRAMARLAAKDLVLRMRRIGLAAIDGQFDEAMVEYTKFHDLMAAAVPQILVQAQPWSLYNPNVHDAHYFALVQTLQAAKNPSN